jgi:glucokinase
MIVLSGDIGGTNTRLQLSQFDENRNHKMLQRQHYSSAKYRNLTEIIQSFLQDANIDQTQIYSACFAVAGPIVQGVVRFTNLPWLVDQEMIKQDLGIARVELINDFQGVGYGIELLKDEDVYVLQDGAPKKNATKALIGAGTGLGVGITSHVGDKYSVLPSEGGHVDFAPVDDVQVDLLLYMRKKYHRISVERLVSGQGLVNIYQFVRDNSLFSEKENPDLHLELHSHGVDAAATITKYAIEHYDIMATRALDIFVRVFGAVAGNLALTTLPYGGLYLVGGIPPKIISQLSDGNFMATFADKGRMSGLLKNIPIYIVKNTRIGLDGAALYASNMPK